MNTNDSIEKIALLVTEKYMDYVYKDISVTEIENIAAISFVIFSKAKSAIIKQQSKLGNEQLEDFGQSKLENPLPDSPRL